MQPDEPNDEERLEELPQDGQTPFQPASPSRDDTMPPDEDGQSGQSDAAKTDDTRPDTDSGIDSTELYNEGVDGAAEIQEPNAGNAVTGYTPPASSGGDDEADLDKADSPS